MAKKANEDQDRSPAIQELFKVITASGVLVLLQFIANIFGLGGYIYVVLKYMFTVFLFRHIVIDQRGIRENTITETSSDYLKRAGIDFALILVGIVMWLLAGIWHGLDYTLTAVEDPRALTGSRSFMTRLLYVQIAHLTCFAFVEFWINAVISVKRSVSQK